MRWGPWALLLLVAVPLGAIGFATSAPDQSQNEAFVPDPSRFMPPARPEFPIFGGDEWQVTDSSDAGNVQSGNCGPCTLAQAIQLASSGDRIRIVGAGPFAWNQSIAAPQGILIEGTAGAWVAGPVHLGSGVAIRNLEIDGSLTSDADAFLVNVTHRGTAAATSHSLDSVAWTLGPQSWIVDSQVEDLQLQAGAHALNVTGDWFEVWDAQEVSFQDIHIRHLEANNATALGVFNGTFSGAAQPVKVIGTTDATLVDLHAVAGPAAITLIEESSRTVIQGSEMARLHIRQSEATHVLGGRIAGSTVHHFYESVAFVSEGHHGLVLQSNRDTLVDGTTIQGRGGVLVHGSPISGYNYAKEPDLRAWFRNIVLDLSGSGSCVGFQINDAVGLRIYGSESSFRAACSGRSVGVATGNNFHYQPRGVLDVAPLPFVGFGLQMAPWAEQRLYWDPTGTGYNSELGALSEDLGHKRGPYDAWHSRALSTEVPVSLGRKFVDDLQPTFAGDMVEVLHTGLAGPIRLDAFWSDRCGEDPTAHTWDVFETTSGRSLKLSAEANAVMMQVRSGSGFGWGTTCVERVDPNVVVINDPDQVFGALTAGASLQFGFDLWRPGQTVTLPPGIRIDGNGARLDFEGLPALRFMGDAELQDLSLTNSSLALKAVGSATRTDVQDIYLRDVLVENIRTTGATGTVVDLDHPASFNFVGGSIRGADRLHTERDAPNSFADDWSARLGFRHTHLQDIGAASISHEGFSYAHHTTSSNVSWGREFGNVHIAEATPYGVRLNERADGWESRFSVHLAPGCADGDVPTTLGEPFPLSNAFDSVDPYVAADRHSATFSDVVAAGTSVAVLNTKWSAGSNQFHGPLFSVTPCTEIQDAPEPQDGFVLIPIPSGADEVELDLSGYAPPHLDWVVGGIDPCQARPYLTNAVAGWWYGDGGSSAESNTLHRTLAGGDGIPVDYDQDGVAENCPHANSAKFADILTLCGLEHGATPFHLPCDPDRDGVPTEFESRHNTDPFDADSVPAVNPSDRDLDGLPEVVDVEVNSAEPSVTVNRTTTDRFTMKATEFGRSLVIAGQVQVPGKPVTGIDPVRGVEVHKMQVGSEFRIQPVSASGNFRIFEGSLETQESTFVVVEEQSTVVGPEVGGDVYSVLAGKRHLGTVTVVAEQNGQRTTGTTLNNLLGSGILEFEFTTGKMTGLGLQPGTTLCAAEYSEKQLVNPCIPVTFVASQGSVHRYRFETDSYSSFVLYGTPVDPDRGSGFVRNEVPQEQTPEAENENQNVPTDALSGMRSGPAIEVHAPLGRLRVGEFIQTEVEIRARGYGHGDSLLIVDAGGQILLNGSANATLQFGPGAFGEGHFQARLADPSGIVKAQRDLWTATPVGVNVAVTGAVVAAVAHGSTQAILSTVGAAGGQAGQEAMFAVGEDRLRNVRVGKKREGHWVLRTIARSIPSLVAALALLTVFFTFEAMDRITWGGFVTNLPVMGLAALGSFGVVYLLEAMLAWASNARLRFRFLLSGAIALVATSTLFRTAIGYPGYLDEDDLEGEFASTPLFAAWRAMMTVAGGFIVVALAVPFLEFYPRFGNSLIELAMVAVFASALPVKPLPGADVWAYRKSCSIGLMVATLAGLVGTVSGLIPVGIIQWVGLVCVVFYWATIMVFFPVTHETFRAPWMIRLGGVVSFAATRVAAAVPMSARALAQRSSMAVDRLIWRTQDVLEEAIWQILQRRKT